MPKWSSESRRAVRSQPPFFCFGRHSENRFRCSRVRSWLQAAVQRIVIYVGSTFSSGSSDAEFLLLIASMRRQAHAKRHPPPGGETGVSFCHGGWTCSSTTEIVIPYPC